MSLLLDFYRGNAADAEGRRLDDILARDDEFFEAAHDFIQWLFPLPEPSRFNRDAPLLTPDDIAAFRAEPELRARLLASFARTLRFLGLVTAADGSVVEGPNFPDREPEVWANPNHNWLRVTRILRSLRLLGLEDRAAAFHDRLREFYKSGRHSIPDDTFRYWTEAAEGRPFHR